MSFPSLGGGFDSHMPLNMKLSKSRGATKHHRPWSKRIARWCLSLIAILLFLPVFNVLITYRGVIYFTPLMLRRQWEAKQENRSYRQHHQWVPFEEINPSLPRAVMASEDNLFLIHNGFSQRGIRHAINEKIANGHVKHGGSTISQQTAKNIFTFGTRSYARKAIETYYTFLIEHIWSKQRIMEVYLNSIEMGDGIYGAEAASQKYFCHKASHLSNAESALIAVCLPNPRKMYPNRPSAYVKKRQSQIISLMPKLGKLDFEHPKNSDLYKKHNR